MSLPFVSCLCPTYNRPPARAWLLEEAIESFLRQDYPGPRELVVLSDAPGQVLALSGAAFRHPDAGQVRFVCLDERIPTLGEKYNRMVELARGQVFLPWEDDDISLPGRISQAVRALCVREAWTNGATLFDYWNPQHSWYAPYQPDGTFRLHSDHTHGVCHNTSAFTRSAWERVGGYPAISGAQDAVMDAALKRLGRTSPQWCMDPADWQYVYRWGVSDCHVSGAPDHDGFYRDWGRRPVAQGVFALTPRWRADYAALARSLAPPAARG